ncbi:MAG: hypothetical protein GQ559_05625 [Desulfobulbaceae bacterium]|nr:hypothetical protein [Desulfobulbaceae bacterium]
MSLEKAKNFVEHLMENTELQEKMSGFSQNELKEAVDQMKKEGAPVGAATSTIIYDCGFVTD